MIVRARYYIGLKLVQACQESRLTRCACQSQIALPPARLCLPWVATSIWSRTHFQYAFDIVGYSGTCTTLTFVMFEEAWSRHSGHINLESGRQSAVRRHNRRMVPAFVPRLRALPLGRIINSISTLTSYPDVSRTQ